MTPVKTHRKPRQQGWYFCKGTLYYDIQQTREHYKFIEYTPLWVGYSQVRYERGLFLFTGHDEKIPLEAGLNDDDMYYYLGDDFRFSLNPISTPKPKAEFVSNDKHLAAIEKQHYHDADQCILHVKRPRSLKYATATLVIPSETHAKAIVDVLTEYYELDEL